MLWPNGLSLDIPQGILYWVDAYYDQIEMVYLNTTERKVGNILIIQSIWILGESKSVPENTRMNLSNVQDSWFVSFINIMQWSKTTLQAM